MPTATSAASKSKGRKKSNWTEKEVFTTGEAAEICNVSQQTIIRCFDSGRLNGFRVPGSRFRRIPRRDLIRFMHANHMPIPPEFGDVRLKILIVGARIEADGFIHDQRFHLHQMCTPQDDIPDGFIPDIVLLEIGTPGLVEEYVNHFLQRKKR